MVGSALAMPGLYEWVEFVGIDIHFLIVSYIFYFVNKKRICEVTNKTQVGGGVRLTLTGIN